MLQARPGRDPNPGPLPRAAPAHPGRVVVNTHTHARLLRAADLSSDQHGPDTPAAHIGAVGARHRGPPAGPRGARGGARNPQPAARAGGRHGRLPARAAARHAFDHAGAREGADSRCTRRALGPPRESRQSRRGRRRRQLDQSARLQLQLPPPRQHRRGRAQRGLPADLRRDGAGGRRRGASLRAGYAPHQQHRDRRPGEQRRAGRPSRRGRRAAAARDRRQRIQRAPRRRAGGRRGWQEAPESKSRG
eukprot:7378401-Prymnesium_polylepis.1